MSGLDMLLIVLISASILSSIFDIAKQIKGKKYLFALKISTLIIQVVALVIVVIK